MNEAAKYWVKTPVLRARGGRFIAQNAKKLHYQSQKFIMKKPEK